MFFTKSLIVICTVEHPFEGERSKDATFTLVELVLELNPAKNKVKGGAESKKEKLRYIFGRVHVYSVCYFRSLVKKLFISYEAL